MIPWHQQHLRKHWSPRPRCIAYSVKAVHVENQLQLLLQNDRRPIWHHSSFYHSLKQTYCPSGFIPLVERPFVLYAVSPASISPTCPITIYPYVSILSLTQTFQKDMSISWTIVHWQDPSNNSTIITPRLHSRFQRLSHQSVSQDTAYLKWNSDISFQVQSWFQVILGSSLFHDLACLSSKSQLSAPFPPPLSGFTSLSKSSFIDIYSEKKTHLSWTHSILGTLLIVELFIPIQAHHSSTENNDQWNLKFFSICTWVSG